MTYKWRLVGYGVGGDEGVRERERETYFAERMKEKKQNSSHW